MRPASSSRLRVRGCIGKTAGSGSASITSTTPSSRSGRSTLPARWTVTRTYAPGSTPLSASAVGRRPLQLRLERGEHARRLVGVGAVVDVQLPIRRGDSQLVEKDPAELVVMVLTGVNQQLVVGLAQLAGDRRGLHELRPVADDRGYQHDVTNGSAGVHLRAR